MSQSAQTRAPLPAPAMEETSLQPRMAATRPPPSPKCPAALVTLSARTSPQEKGASGPAMAKGPSGSMFTKGCMEGTRAA